jgi:hypothetical protein
MGRFLGMQNRQKYRHPDRQQTARGAQIRFAIEARIDRFRLERVRLLICLLLLETYRDDLYDDV